MMASEEGMELLEAGAQAWGLELTRAQLQAFELYYQELIAWNERVNLTTITEYEDVQVKHFLDSLSCLQPLAGLPVQARCIDIGAGAGFPGLPVKIARPQMSLTLLEASGKKTRFLERVVALLGLESVEVVKGRAEDLAHGPGHREAYDAAFARAVADLVVLVEYALPLTRIGGLFVAQKGVRVEGEVEAAREAIEILGGELKELTEVFLPGLEAPRHLVVVQKVAPTPQKYPRRPGIPAKRPLSGRSLRD
jgi:16S rRNA (guanine527-N7)-methyltransferase